MIRALSGDDLRVWRDENHAVIEWAEGEYRIVFSYSRATKAVSAHFACGKESLRMLKTAIEEFCHWVFTSYEWCNSVLAVISKPSVVRVVEKCGFEYLTTKSNYLIYVRLKK